MRRVLLTKAVIFATLLVCRPAWSAPEPQTSPAKPSQQAKEKTTSLTGCVDEQEGRYVLVDEKALSRIANLEADGFPPEGFAKHVGHKVTVRGTGSANGSVPLFKVRSIETVSETCAPAGNGR